MQDPHGDDGAFYQPWLDPDRDYSAGEPPTSHTGVAGTVEKRVLGTSRTLDRLQASHGLIAFPYAAFKKYADDEGSRLAALLAYYTFMSLFPLAIAGFALLNTLLVGNPEYVDQLVADIVPPEYQSQVISAYESLPSGGAALAIALIGLVLAGTAGVFSMYAIVNQVFCVPYRFRYGFGPRYARVLLMVVLMGIGVLVVTVGSALVVNLTGYAFAQRAAASILLWLVASSLLYAAATFLTRRSLTFGEVGLGAGLGGLAMTTLIGLGSALFGRFVAGSSAVYGVFGTVVGIFSVLFLVSNAIVFSFEISVVRAWQLWPRGVDINLLFPADERAYALLTLMDERMPSQRNGVAFDATGHDDPRRAALASLMRRPSGVPVHPYAVGSTRRGAPIGDSPQGEAAVAEAAGGAPSGPAHGDEGAPAAP
ncbi:MAG TPA: YhjD/YihY/BrkB family envelope integrity protein [Motilibacterales bacterium]|nr:YhjD/YihY/BrkB family envelope integrity protein [Motilibacterales bacterium]